MIPSLLLHEGGALNHTNSGSIISLVCSLLSSEKGCSLLYHNISTLLKEWHLYAKVS